MNLFDFHNVNNDEKAGYYDRTLRWLGRGGGVKSGGGSGGAGGGGGGVRGVQWVRSGGVRVVILKIKGGGGGRAGVLGMGAHVGCRGGWGVGGRTGWRRWEGGGGVEVASCQVLDPHSARKKISSRGGG